MNDLADIDREAAVIKAEIHHLLRGRSVLRLEEDCIVAAGISQQYLDLLEWNLNKQTANDLRTVYVAYSSAFGKPRLQRQLAQETGYRDRVKRGLLPQDEPWEALGSDVDARQRTVQRLAEDQGDIVTVPSQRDRGLVGRPVYPWCNPTNPYAWVPVIARHSASALKATVWEVGPGVSSSASAVGRLLDRDVYLIKLPAPGTDRHEVRQIHDNLAVEEIKPDLILVPFVVPLDVYSVLQTIRLLVLPGMETVWIRKAGENISGKHPEFALNLDDYLASAIARLRTFKGLVATGAKICTSAPMVAGLPAALEQAVRRDVGWRAIDRITVLEQGGRRHYWNGSSLVGECLIVWEADARFT
ncbi:MAG: hypothetical protein HY897_23235 [Deltaproteobacteria bacterium]|nr:hypothetical protein [Deltaproteobacteria bacterium]